MHGRFLGIGRRVSGCRGIRSFLIFDSFRFFDGVTGNTRVEIHLRKQKSQNGEAHEKDENKRPILIPRLRERKVVSDRGDE